MAQVFRPSQRRLVPGLQSRIDWSHPLARDLKYFRFVGDFSRDPILNLLGENGIWETNTGTPANGGVGQEGPAFASLNSSYRFGYGGGTPTSKLIMPQVAGTVSLRTTAGWSPTDGVNHRGTSISDVAITTFALQKFSDNNWYVGWFDGGPNDSRVAAAASGTFTAGETVNVTGTYSFSAVSRLYVKGVLVGSSGANTTLVSPTGCYIGLGDSVSTGGPWNTTADSAIYYLAIWSRALSADEAKLLDADPYCFLISAEGELPALFVPAVTPTTVRHLLPMLGVGA